jgi:hypothetical protein
MRRKQLVLATTAVAGILAMGACGGSNDASPPAEPAAPAPATTTTQATTPETTESMTTEQTTRDETSTDEAPRPEAVVVTVKDGQPVGGTKTVKVKQGDEVVIRIEVDAPQELHLHGYDIEQEAAPGTPAVFRFTADLEGIFELESHLDDAKVVKLVVNP